MSSHPSHPALVHFPIAFWVSTSMCDWVALAWPKVWPLGNGLLVLGCVAALPAAATGIWQSVKLQPSRAMEKVLTWHLSAAATAWLFYLMALVLRVDDGALGPAPWISIVCSGLGLCFLLAAGWLGGTLVYRYGAGVSRSARE